MKNKYVDVLVNSHTFGYKIFLFWTALAVILYYRLIGDGLFLTDDSLNYLAASISFRKELNFMGEDGSFYTYWPPLYPMILALLGRNTIILLPFLHIFCFIVLSYLYFLIIKKHIINHTLGHILFVVLIFSVNTSIQVIFLWSELFFILLMLGYLKSLITYIDHRKGKFLILSIFLGNLMILQRHAGVFILGGSFIFLLVHVQLSVKEKLTTILSLSCCLILFIIWRIYLYLYIPPEYESIKQINLSGLWKSIFWMVSNLGYNMIPMSRPVYESFLLGLFIVGTLVITSLQKKSSNFMKLASCIALSYIILFSMLSPDVFEQFDRYQSPIFPLILFALCYQLDRLRKTKYFFTVLLICLLWTLYPIARLYKNLGYWQKRKIQTQTEYRDLLEREPFTFFSQP
jgi:hypothetical protein